MNFASDNAYGVHPDILAAMADANGAAAPSYGGDALTKRSEERLADIFGCELRLFMVASGTAANGLALAAITPSHGAVFCHAESHIASDECNAPEHFTGGAKIIGLEGRSAKITPDLIENCLKGFIRGERDPKPRGVSLTNATELGTIYSPTEVKAISDLIRPRGLKLHMDGARFANAVASLGCSPADLAWKAGVDVLSFGATKNGAMMLDAVVIFDLALAEDFAYRQVRSGQLISKSRFLGAQMLAYLDNGLWLGNARHANGLAQRLAAGLGRVHGVRIPAPVEANIVFATMPQDLHDRLKAAGAVFFQRYPSDVQAALQPGDVAVRMVTSCTMAAESVDAFVALARRESGDKP